MQHLSLLVAEAARRTIENLEKAMPHDEANVAQMKRQVLLCLAEMQEPTRHRPKILLVLNPEEEEE